MAKSKKKGKKTAGKVAKRHQKMRVKKQILGQKRSSKAGSKNLRPVLIALVFVALLSLGTMLFFLANTITGKAIIEDFKEKVRRHVETQHGKILLGRVLGDKDRLLIISFLNAEERKAYGKENNN